ncbi:MAG: hypothetical protein WBG91_14955 [Syntrophobacteria bacterium]
MKNLVLKAKSELHGFVGKDRELFWSTGVLEYWSVGKIESPNFNLNESFHYSTTPPLHHSSRLPQGGKTIEARSGGSTKPGLLGPDSFL